MFVNYLKIALRNLRWKKGYTAINLVGLATGIALCLVMMLYVLHEFSFDRFHERGDRIYRVIYNPAWTAGAAREPSVYTPTILAPLFRRQIPEVESAVRFFDSFGSVLVSTDDKVFEEERFFYADSTVFNIFSLQLLVGSNTNALTRPRCVVVTQSIARKYFGDANPIGKMLTLNNRTAYEVTGIMADVPFNSHLQFDFLASFSSLDQWANREIWSEANFYTYLLLREGAEVQNIQAITEAVIRNAIRSSAVSTSFDAGVILEPLTDVYLRSQFRIRNQPAGSLTALFVVSTIAVFVLLIACINYMNLATARSQRRAREVGVRKVTGAQTSQIAVQFLIESGLLTLLAILLAVMVVEIMLPSVNALLNTRLSLNYLENPQLLVPLILVWLVVTLLAGSYPAFYLASVLPGAILKPMIRTAGGAPLLRKALVVTQFAISLILISGTIVFFQQIRFMNSKELGFSKEQVITFRISDGRTIESLPRLHSELSRIPGVVQASAASRPPVNISSGYSIRKEGVADRGGLIVSAMPVDHRFIQTLSITVIAGSGLHEVNPTDTAWYFVLNESAVRALDWTPEVAVGKSLLMSGRRKGVVTGVMKDFNIKSLHTPLEPFVLFNSREAGYTRDIGYLLVKLAPQSLPRVLGELEKVWREMVPHRPFQFTFLDEELDALYRSEQRLGTLVAVFAGFAVVIACLGLFALTAFTAEQRTKEIGVRKVLGATVSAIVALLSKDFLALVAIGFLVGAPVSYIGLSEWLQNFAYRIDLGYEYFLLAGVTMLVIALATVSFQAIRAALANPVEALRYE